VGGDTTRTIDNSQFNQFAMNNKSEFIQAAIIARSEAEFFCSGNRNYFFLGVWWGPLREKKFWSRPCIFSRVWAVPILELRAFSKMIIFLNSAFFSCPMHFFFLTPVFQNPCYTIGPVK
jgi:hypothetical protein